jgi:adenylosuccinate synthase
VLAEPPLSVDGYADVDPLYEDLPGWKESTVGITEYGALPPNARKYLERLQALANVPIDMISTGPDREQTIVLRNPFD